MWLKQCHKLAMTGNGKYYFYIYTIYKDADDWGLVYDSFTHIINGNLAELLHWLVVSTPLKNISQLGCLFPIYGK